MSINKANKVVIEASSPTMHKTRLYSFEKQDILIGRSFGCDVILDDDFISPEHLKISLTGDDCYRLTDLNSENGTYISKDVLQDEGATFESGQVCRIGKTKLRIYRAQHAIKATRRLNFGTKLQGFFSNPVISFLIFSLSVVFGTIYSWVIADPINFMDEEVYKSAFAVASSILVLSIIGAVGKLVSHKKPQFTGEVSSYSLIVFSLVFYIWFIQPYLFFYVTTMVVSWVVTISVTMVFFIALGFFASYIEEGRIVRKTMGFAFILGSFIAGLSLLDDIGYSDSPSYPAQIMVGDYSGITLVSSDEFLKNSEDLFDRSEAE